MDAAASSGLTRNDGVETPGSTKDRFDPEVIARYELYLWQLNLQALSRTAFLRGPGGGQQHLDVGCGTGGFTRTVLLPRGGPVTRIVGADISPAMVDFARRNNAQARMVYDLLDISSDEETSAFVGKYGQFERVYSFLCFHMVPDQTAAFRNIGRLMTTEGECLVTACVTNPALDAWLDLYKMPEWKHLVTDPRVVMASSAVRFHYSGNKAQIEEETRRCASNAELECIACEVIDCPWLVPDLGLFCGQYMAAFLVDAKVPPQRRKALIEAYTKLLLPGLKKTPSGWELSVSIYRVHARLR